MIERSDNGKIIKWRNSTIKVWPFVSSEPNQLIEQKIYNEFMNVYDEFSIRHHNNSEMLKVFETDEILKKQELVDKINVFIKISESDDKIAEFKRENYDKICGTNSYPEYEAICVEDDDLTGFLIHEDGEIEHVSLILKITSNMQENREKILKGLLFSVGLPIEIIPEARHQAEIAFKLHLVELLYQDAILPNMNVSEIKEKIQEIVNK
ncbi:hypothetical protein [Curvivirga sp.]|uniref:hypothetical protein n=1 Tax=Curvivirga sp. TaxID=2856848 RepID=UPI003B5CFC64